MKKNEEMSIRELCNLQYQNKKLVVPLGYANKKKLLFINFEKISGLFIAGATGTGKSVFIDDLVVGLMYKNNPNEVKFVMLDPKKIELGEYSEINHLVDKERSAHTQKGYDLLLNVLKLLEYRVSILIRTHHRTISGYNRKEKTSGLISLL